MKKKILIILFLVFCVIGVLYWYFNVKVSEDDKEANYKKSSTF